MGGCTEWGCTEWGCTEFGEPKKHLFLKGFLTFSKTLVFKGFLGGGGQQMHNNRIFKAAAGRLENYPKTHPKPQRASDRAPLTVLVLGSLAFIFDVSLMVF